MKALIRYIAPMLILVSLLPCCNSQRRSAYQFPEHFAPEIKSLYIERAEKGRALYKAYCSDCHGIFTKGKDGVPNFTTTQIDNYQAAALLGIDPRNHAVARKLNQLQVDHVMIFLRFRNKDDK